MKSKKFVTAVILSIFLMFGFLQIGLIAGEDEPPDEITINNEGYKFKRRGPVHFEHLSHSEDYDIACNECHHDYQDGKNVWQEGDPVNKCIDCHDPNESDGNIKNLRLSFHRNCKTCHKDMAREGITEDAPFKKCSGCHEKK